MHYPYESISVPVQNTVNLPTTSLVQPVEINVTETPLSATGEPTVIPAPPHFQVPSNPLLPGEYKEILSYDNLQYMNGFLRTQIGKECMASMSIGTAGTFASRLGYLVGVGINYFILQDPCSEEILVVDFFSLRMIQFFGKRCPVNLLI